MADVLIVDDSADTGRALKALFRIAGHSARCVDGLRAALDYLTATATRMAMGATMGAFHERYDLLLTPTVPITPFVAGEEVPIGWHSQRWTSWTPFTYPFNMTQQPAASVPCGWTSAGMPIGLQVVGPRHADDRVLAACAAYEQVEPWIYRRPPLLLR